MKTLIILTGAAGAGKTTVGDAVSATGAALFLKPFTTRDRRSDSDDEYHFLSEAPLASNTAWMIEHKQKHYGMLLSELDRIPEGRVGLTVFDPLQLQILEDFRSRPDFEVITIGLDTIETAEEQARRTNGAERRQHTGEELSRVRDILTTTDLTLKGNQGTVVDAVHSVCRLMASRNGVLTRRFLEPLIAAGGLLVQPNGATITRREAIQEASYDLLMGNELWCGGFKDLTENEAIFEIPPYSYAIVKADEQARLPTFVVGQFDLKVSLFLSGIILSNGPQIDPGYRGDLFCLLFNGSSTPYPLRMGDHFATIQFTTVCRTTQRYGGIYSLKEKLRNNMPPQLAVGKGGDIFSKMETDIEKAKKEVSEKIPPDRTGIYLSIIAAISALSLAITGWGFATINSANSARQAAESATKELQDIIAEYRRSVPQSATPQPPQALSPSTSAPPSAAPQNP